MISSLNVTDADCGVSSTEIVFDRPKYDLQAFTPASVTSKPQSIATDFEQCLTPLGSPILNKVAAPNARDGRSRTNISPTMTQPDPTRPNPTQPDDLTRPPHPTVGR